MNNLHIEAKKRSDNRTVLLRFNYTYKGRRYFPTGVVIPLQDFDGSNLEKPVLKSHPNHRHYNSIITNVVHRITAIQSTLILQRKAPTADLVFQMFNENEEVEVEKINDPIIKSLFQEFLLFKGPTASTYKLYKTTFEQFEECFKNVRVSDFDSVRWAQFRDFLQKKKNHSTNTICIRLRKLRTFIIYLKEVKKLAVPLGEFNVPEEERKKISMDTTDLNKVRNYSPTTEAMKQIQDLCLIQCYTCLRISDLRGLSPFHIIERKGRKFISMIAYKSKKHMMIPLTDEVDAILAKYNYSPPVVAEQYYNRELKKLLRLSGVDRTIETIEYDKNGEKIKKRKPLWSVFTNHCCTRSAVYYFLQYFSLLQVSAIVGKDKDTILKYYCPKVTEDDIANLVESSRFWK